MKKYLTGFLSLALAITLTGVFSSARAAAVTVGNDAAARTQVDTFSNFTIIDTNNPAATAGALTNFSYYASNTNAFRFVLVDSANMVKWVSDEITPAASGVNSFVPMSDVAVTTGDNLGLYFVSTGTIPFEFTGAPASYTANGAGLPSVGNTLSFAGSSDRTYSFIANGGTTEANFSVSPSVFDPDNTGTAVAEWRQDPSSQPGNKDACKNGGWRNFSNPSFRNQGQCVSFFEHNGSEVNNNNFYLYLAKNAATSTNSSAGASLDGIDNIVLSELGFDYMGYCGAGAPRFNVFTTSGVYYFFGCTYGTHTDLGNGWTRVRFNNADAVPSDGTTVFPGFGNVTVTGIEIVQDEMGQVKLDNIDVNSTLVGQP